MNPDNNEDVVITYTYIKKHKWKTETKQINKDDLHKFEDSKYRILNIVSLDDYYREIDL